MPQLNRYRTSSRFVPPTFHVVFLLLTLGSLAAVEPSAAASFASSDLVVAESGHVQVTFVSAEAGYTSDLYLLSPSNSFGLLFTNHTTPPDAVINLGFLEAGTELVFRLNVRNTGFDYFSGNGELNPDGVSHVLIESLAEGARAYVGFEDLFGGGDRDYNDLIVSITNVRSMTAVPEPSTLLLAASGLLFLLLLRGKLSGYRH